MQKAWAMWFQRLLYLCALSAGAITLQTFCCPESRAAASVGQPAPALVVDELDGTHFTLADHLGQIVIVNIWATWCGPCRLEMPALDNFYRQHHGHGIEMIGLSADRPHDRKDVVTLMSAFSYPAAMLGDAHANGFGTPAVLPMTYVIGPDGIVRAQMKPSDTPITVKNLEDVVLSLTPAEPSRPSP
ncbi:MAG: TlpA family protein disulfide reductase [Rhodospirillaceae bacterium]|nr:MAG: TlpA family protein disulfide reductase [Rhodospirillaceae bacterium]